MPIKADTFSNLASVVEDGCLLGDLVLSQSAVTVSGPATEINRITSVKAVAKIDSVLKKTTTFDPGIELITNDGTQLEYSVVNFGDKNITLTVPVLKIVTLPTVVEFKNAPAYFVSNPLSYTVTPSSVSVAVPVEAIATTNAFVVDTVDFADLTNSLNNFNVSADSINSYKITDSSVKSFKIRIDATKFSSKTVTIPADSVILKNSRDDFDIQIDKSKDITINLIGPEASLEKITAANIAVEIDTADKTIAKDTKTLPAKITVSGVEDCWATGKNEIKITAVSIE